MVFRAFYLYRRLGPPLSLTLVGREGPGGARTGRCVMVVGLYPSSMGVVVGTGHGATQGVDGWEGMCGWLGVMNGEWKNPETVVANLNFRRRELISFEFVLQQFLPALFS